MPVPVASPPIQVALVEDDAVVVQSWVAAFATAGDMRLHSFARAAEARTLFDRAPADVLVVDLGFPQGPGLDIVRLAQERWPDCLVLVRTVPGDEAHAIRSVEAGAIGYVPKAEPPARAIEAVRTVHAGGSPVSPLVARRLIVELRKMLAAEAADVAVRVHAEHARLSPREREVLEYITKGLSYQEMGQRMGVSRNTVLSFVRRIYAKLEVRSQVEAIHEARSQGLLAP